MKIMSKGRLATAFVLGSVTLASAQTADDIAEKALSALGGRAALGKVTSRSTTGTMTISTPGGDISGSIETLNEAPNKARVLINMDLTPLGGGAIVLDQRFDGQSGYALDTMRGDHDITGSQLENMRNNYFPTPLLSYKERETKMEVAGTEKVGDRDAYVVNVTPKTGPPSKVFIDAQSYLPVKQVMRLELPDIGEVEQTTELSDYREVDGIQVPHKIKSSSRVQAFTIAVTKVQHNVKVDETLFSKPAAK